MRDACEDSSDTLVGAGEPRNRERPNQNARDRIRSSEDRGVKGLLTKAHTTYCTTSSLALPSSLFTGDTDGGRARPTATHATVKAAELGRQRHTTVNTQSLNYDIRDLLHTTQGEGEKAEAGNPMQKLPAHTSNRLHRTSILYRSCVHS